MQPDHPQTSLASLGISAAAAAAKCSIIRMEAWIKDFRTRHAESNTSEGAEELAQAIFEDEAASSALRAQGQAYVNALCMLQVLIELVVHLLALSRRISLSRA